MPYETSFDPDGPDDLTLEITSTVSALSNRPVDQLPQLYPVVDLEGIEQTLCRRTADTQVFTFTYHDYLITVGGDSTITYREQ
ncbi:HalOD1 output domain-containing protein [Natrinema versiforme]|uniref:Halobacterial output domain-containing protein n=1 Tax=Natrinema versiforme TaxID=88724 RepID=A0A4V1G0B3_9EURY|nr:HalOD1 output domain-containing protein [Natrinema versiforme]QCS44746.1 hypothetical protein FEJ81_20950 [Natrinema versiforme]